MNADPDGLPDHLKERPDASYKWDFPTAWLLGTKLLTSLRDILLSALFKTDPREWMSAETVVHPPVKDPPGPEPAECWIDFLADTGDSARLVYQLAYLLQQDQLEVRAQLWPGKPRHDDLLTDPSGAPLRLPRGSLLIFGGDTAYPVATRGQLVERLRAPFIWARRKLEAEGRAAPRTPAVPVLAIPGNHDYYNMLNGYQRQFRGLAPNSAMVPAAQTPRLDLPGYTSLQQASYFAVELPHRWQLWGFDIERHGMDRRQHDYFKRQAPSSRRIVITSRPAVVNHAVSEDGPRLHTILNDLAVTAAFDRDGELDEGQIRLDLSGDTHLYERYWGPSSRVVQGEAPAPSPLITPRQMPPVEVPRGTTPGTSTDAPRARPDAGRRGIATARANYASVVSGLGGAFHHPGQLRFGDVTPQSAWPPAEHSIAAIGERLVRPRKMFQAGGVGVIGMIVAGLCAWLAYHAGGDNLLDVPLWLPARAAELRCHLVNLGVTASIVVAIAGTIGILYGGAWLARRMARPIGDTHPTGCWARLTHWLAYNDVSFWCLRWVGGNRRNVWRFAISLPAWLITIGAEVVVIGALVRCPYLARADDGYAPLYLTVTLLVLVMTILAAVRAASRRGVLVRVMLGGFGALVGGLIVWTPYAWMRVIVDGGWRAGVAIALFVAYWAIRRAMKWLGLYAASTPRRRAVTVLAFAALVAYFVVAPRLLFTHHPLAHPVVGILLATFLGGYFVCLWLGWYFFVCLQFGMHGNEAGVAARVVQFAEFVRMKLTADEIEVWVIAPEAPTPTPRSRWAFWRAHPADDDPVSARVIDHFKLRAS